MEVFQLWRERPLCQKLQEGCQGEVAAGKREPAKRGARGSAGNSTGPKIEKKLKLDEHDAPQMLDKGKRILVTPSASQSPKHGLFVEGIVRNTRCSFLVDTGSTDTLISSKVYYQMPREQVYKA